MYSCAQSGAFFTASTAMQEDPPSLGIMFMFKTNNQISFLDFTAEEVRVPQNVMIGCLGLSDMRISWQPDLRKSFEHQAQLECL